jgi:peptidyl-prolyl cis-trans isomerase A (cyclophilin A)
VFRTAFVAAGFAAAVCVLAGAQAPASRAAPTAPLLNPDDPAFKERAPARFFVRLETSKGLVLLDVERRLAPNGVDRFHNLVRHGFYDNARFFRVVKPRFVQFGIAGDPAVAEIWRTRTIPDDPRIASNVRGAVSYAFGAANGRTTQVFINLRDNAAEFDKEPFVPFAHVFDGMDVVDMLYADYGETAGGGIRAGKQDLLFTGGNAFLQKEFPELDYIIRATVISL